MNNISNTSNKFRGEILTKIYKVWLTRKFLPIFIAEIVTLSAVIYGLVRLVFFKKVIENAMRMDVVSASGVFKYLALAFARTPMLTKTLIVALVVLLALLVRLITQGILRWILVRKNYFGKSDRSSASGNNL